MMIFTKRPFYIITVLLFITSGIYACTNDKEENSSKTTDTEVERTASNVSGLMKSLNIYHFTEPRNALDFELTSLEEKRLGLAQYRGKVVLVSFWTTW